MSVQPKVAFVTGVNGISGNAIVEHMNRTPKTEWSKIIITSRSPLKTHWQDPRVEFVALDFLSPVETLIPNMTPCCTAVTHAYFTSYVHSDDFAKLKETNVPLFQKFLTAIDTVARETLQRHYGAHLHPIPQPCSEEHPRYDDKGENFYYPQEDFLFALQRERKWTYNIIRPNGIVGQPSAPTDPYPRAENGMSEALTLALYFLISRETGETPRFPGNVFYNCPDDNSYAPSLAQMSVWATTHPDPAVANGAFNHVNGDTFVWRYFFPRIGAYFGIDVPDSTFTRTSTSASNTNTNSGTGTGTGTHQENEFRMASWAAAPKNQRAWESLCAKYGGNADAFTWGTWAFFDWGVGKAWRTLSSVSKARRFGWNRYDDTFESWIETFWAFENAGGFAGSRWLRGGVQVQV
ncbi:hypothetical protein BDW74DRAFT_187241 [Aspergillus multicolor]|uniref:SDR family oxidoreductase n=1 Tax=Aspergillus multicolor TaxID=41759 RepID=UPI003CCCA1C0